MKEIFKRKLRGSNSGGQLLQAVGLGHVVVFASLVVGTIDTFGRVFFPEFSYFTIFVPMAIICVVKPEGLFVASEKSLTIKAIKKAMKGVAAQ